MEEKKVPNLRFEGFTDDWEQCKLGEVVSRKTRKTDSAVIPKIEYEDIISGTGTLKNSEPLYNNKAGILFDENNILLGYLRPYNENWIRPLFSGKAVGDFWVIESNINDGFVYYFIQTDYFSYYFNITTGTKMPRADWGVVKNVSLYIPCDEEQKIINEFLSTLDNLITLYKRKLELLEELKRYLLDVMFANEETRVPELRFEGFDGEWKKCRLGDVTDYQSSNFSNATVSEMKLGNNPVFDANETIACIEDYQVNETYISILKDGAGAGRIELRPPYSSVISTMGILKSKDVDIEFLYYTLLNVHFERYITGTTIPHIYYKDYKTETLFVPNSLEQDKIKVLLNKVFMMHGKIEEKITNLEKFKTYLLDNLFV